MYNPQSNVNGRKTLIIQLKVAEMVKGATDDGVELLFVLLYAANSVGDEGFCLEGDDASGIEVVEAEPKHGEIGGELGAGSVEEDVFLSMGFEMVGREKGGEALVRSRVG
nr:hypothetical protein Iba_scaffold405973CG0010 [Ipomoea batatas]